MSRQWLTYAKRILQEFLLADSILIFADRDEISYQTFVSAVTALKLYGCSRAEISSFRASYDTPAGFLHHEDYSANLDLVHEMILARNSRARVGVKNPSLYQCSRMLMNRQCSDERDKVYAALGLAADNLAIRPDYTLSLAEVCLDLAKKSLLAGDFSILHYAETPTDDWNPSGRPSFIPQLNRQTEANRPRSLGGRDTPIYTAGLARPPVVHMSSSSSIDIQGVMVDEILHLDTFADVLPDLTQGHGSPLKPQLLRAYERVKQHYHLLPGSSSSRTATLKLSFWRTINLGFLLQQKDTPYYDRGVDFRFLDLRYRTNIAHCFHKRIFFMTRKGYFGLGPKWTKQHDKVVIFDGAETPFLLRNTAVGEDSAGWNLVGDCYLDGWMDGDYHDYEILSETRQGSTGGPFWARHDGWKREDRRRPTIRSHRPHLHQDDPVERKVLVTKRFVIH